MTKKALVLVACSAILFVALVAIDIVRAPKGPSDPCGQIYVGESKLGISRRFRLFNDVGEVWSIGSSCLDGQWYNLSFRRHLLLMRVDTISIFFSVPKDSLSIVSKTRTAARRYGISIPDIEHLPFRDTTITVTSPDSHASFEYVRKVPPIAPEDAVVYTKFDMAALVIF
jgi:hypothetical protein